MGWTQAHAHAMPRYAVLRAHVVPMQSHSKMSIPLLWYLRFVRLAEAGCHDLTYLDGQIAPGPRHDAAESSGSSPCSPSLTLDQAAVCGTLEGHTVA